MTKQDTTGIVYLVGAGPGDPDLITVKGSRLLQKCDVVVYDNLVPQEIIVTLPDRIERRYVGKRPGQHSISQEEINLLLVSFATEGKRVVRLKGGDPFIFGRGGEEVQALHEHDIPVVVVPGVTAGVAAPAYAGIACTDRRWASFVMFLTGRQAKDGDSVAVPWDWVGKLRNGTLVIYMGVAEAEKTVARLLDGGMSPQTPAIVIERGTYPTQRNLATSLEKLPDLVRREHLRPPALFVIGEGVTLPDVTGWLQQQPLHGVRVMVTRPADQAGEMYRSLRELGAEVIPFPTIATREEYDKAAWEEFLRVNGSKKWLVFTSENGVRYFMKQWDERIGDLRRLGDYSIAAVGEGTSRALQANRIKSDFIPTVATTAELARQMVANIELSDVSVIRVRGNLGDDRVEKTLRQAGAQVLPLSVYATSHVKWTYEAKEKLFDHPPDVIIFTSGSTVDGTVLNLEAPELKRLTDNAIIVSIGPSTSEIIRSYGMKVGLEAKVHTIPAIVSELVEYYRTISDKG